MTNWFICKYNQQLSRYDFHSSLWCSVVKDPVTEPSVQTRLSIVGTQQVWGRGRWQVAKKHRKAIWKDSPDMGHYFERDAPLFRLQREPCFYYISQLSLFLPESSLTSYLVDFWRPKPWPQPWPSGVTHAAANLARNAQMLAKVGFRCHRACEFTQRTEEDHVSCCFTSQPHRPTSTCPPPYL